LQGEFGAITSLRGRQRAQEFNRLVEPCLSLYHGRTLSNLLRRSLKAMYSSLHIPTMAVMMCKFRDMLINLFLVYSFDCSGDPLVKAPASFEEDGTVCDLLRQRMLEGVFQVADCGLLVDKLPRLQVIELAS